MNIPEITIAVDGCSSTGKSSFSRKLAYRLGFIYLDSGALYRGVTLFAMEQGLISAVHNDSGDLFYEVSPLLQPALSGLELHFGLDGGIFMGPRRIDREIRSMEVSSRVSPVSALAYVRNYVDDRLHSMAAGGSVVMDGRDIGTTVLPDAEFKIYMTASEEVRARRRYEELKASGNCLSLEEVLSNIRERDRIDSSRQTSPLRCPPDAFVLDNSDMTIEEELFWAEGVIRGKFNILR